MNTDNSPTMVMAMAALSAQLNTSPEPTVSLFSEVPSVYSPEAQRIKMEKAKAKRERRRNKNSSERTSAEAKPYRNPGALLGVCGHKMESRDITVWLE